jgi:hypothetical protein
MTDDGQISEADKLKWRNRFEELGVDRVYSALNTDPFRLIGPTEVQNIAWEWIREKKAKQEKIFDIPPLYVAGVKINLKKIMVDLYKRLARPMRPVPPWITAFTVALITSALMTTAIIIPFSLQQRDRELQRDRDRELRTSLATWGPAEVQNGEINRIDKENMSSTCPQGTYAVGFAFKIEDGLAHGALWTGHIVCRPLNLP